MAYDFEVRTGVCRKYEADFEIATLGVHLAAGCAHQAGEALRDEVLKLAPTRLDQRFEMEDVPQNANSHQESGDQRSSALG